MISHDSAVLTEIFILKNTHTNGTKKMNQNKSDIDQISQQSYSTELQWRNIYFFVVKKTTIDSLQVLTIHLVCY